MTEWWDFWMASQLMDLSLSGRVAMREARHAVTGPRPRAFTEVLSSPEPNWMSKGQEDSLRSEMATHSVREIPWMEGARQGHSPWGCKKSDTTEWLQSLQCEKEWIEIGSQNWAEDSIATSRSFEEFQYWNEKFNFKFHQFPTFSYSVPTKCMFPNYNSIGYHLWWSHIL